MNRFEEQSHLFDFDWVRKELANYALSAPAKQRALQLIPLNAQEAIDHHNKVDEIRKLPDIGKKFPLEPFPDISESLFIVNKPGASLSAGQLFDIKQILDISATLSRFYSKDKSLFPSLADTFERLSPLNLLRRAFSGVFDEHGEIKDSASPQLKELRKQKAALEKKLHREIDKLQQLASKNQWLQEENPTIRDGRLVLPMKTEHKRKIKGVIHGQSSTGLTTYIEPLEIVEINNEIMDAHLSEQEEIRRILFSLCEEVRTYFPDIKNNFNNLIELDFYYACARMAREMKAVKPVISDEREFEFHNARNPVLESTRPVVPLNLKMNRDVNIILITGPNAGGKTVVIKTVALLSAMALSGLHIPADAPAIIPSFVKFFVDIGDQQSITEDLSTFSSHLENLKYILENATEDSLIILDEIGTGTDPSEGAALAQSILESLNSPGIKTLATTHHGVLKAFAQETPGILNAAMEFDLKDLSPTYRLRLGVPGNSYALEISRRLGLPDNVLAKAAELIGSQNTEITSLLTRLEEAYQKNREQERILERQKNTLDKLIEKYERKINEIEAERKKLKKSKIEELDELIKQANREIQRTIREIKETQASSESIKASGQIIQKLSKTVDKHREKPTPRQGKKYSYAIGDWVKIIPFDSLGRITGIVKGKNRMTVDVEGKSLKVGTELLEPAKAPKRTKNINTYSVEYQRPGSFRLDLRGFRVDEARTELDKFLNNSVLAGLREVEILHGKGTGALQTMVHEELARFPSVKSFHFAPYESGGPGITQVEFYS